uniref:GH18 domain-containing protein n=1 Tax=Oryza glumipatula TaxID=40148 RepID=A0A0D9YS09_9ORYZ
MEGQMLIIIIPTAILVFAKKALLFLAVPPVATADDPGLAVYWGRHKEEGSPREACDTGRYTTVIIFYNAFGYGRYSLDISGHPLAAVGADIKHCKSRGVTVLLSISGQGGGYSLPTNASAAYVADNLWNAYLGSHRAGVARPFGDDAAVDGIDFFIDQGGDDHYDDLARRLNGYNYYCGRVVVLLTATTSCSYPDHRLEKALATGVFARIHVRMFGDEQ